MHRTIVYDIPPDGWAPHGAIHPRMDDMHMAAIDMLTTKTNAPEPLDTEWTSLTG